MHECGCSGGLDESVKPATQICNFQLDSSVVVTPITDVKKRKNINIVAILVNALLFITKQSCLCSSECLSPREVRIFYSK